MCYTFDLLGPAFNAAYIRKVMTTVQDTVTNGWVCWAFSNHDVMRHVTRFIEAPEEQDRVAKLSITLISVLRGSICLYQGEELGLTEAELSYEDLRDPYGIRFWPAFKGRDGCRTPMVWEASEPHAGFTTGSKTWLPVPGEHAARAVDAQEGLSESVLHHYRAALAFRKAHPALRPANFYSGVDNNGNVMEQLRWFKPDGAQADTAYFTNANNHAIAWRIDGSEFGDSASAIYVAYNGWSGNVNFTLPWPGAGKQWYRVTDTATWNEGPDTVVVPGSEALIGGEYTVYGLQGRSVLLLIAK